MNCFTRDTDENTPVDLQFVGCFFHFFEEIRREIDEDLSLCCCGGHIQ